MLSQTANEIPRLVWLVVQLGFIGRGGGEVQRLDARVRFAHAVVDQNAHQLGQGGRPVRRGAERGRIGGHQRIKGVTHLRPLAVDFQKALAFE